ncbi:MAG: AMP-binding protein, partial [Clostridia bacterium]|nr:AMP-binding protein [Clostridia bacterium]
MKLGFSTSFVQTPDFLSLCNLAEQYGYGGIELSPSDVTAPTPDGLFGSDRIGAGRKLRNRHLSAVSIHAGDPVGDTEADGARVKMLVRAAAGAHIPYVILVPSDGVEPQNIRATLKEAIREAEDGGVTLLFETLGAYANTARLLELLHHFTTDAVGAAWNVRATYFEGGESAEDTITSLGAYISYVRMGDRREGEDCLLGEGTLPVAEFDSALRSLNYDGYYLCDTCGEMTDPDLVLTHYAAYMNRQAQSTVKRRVYENRAGTGTFPWKRYDVLNLTFSQVLDTMVDLYPDQYAFRYTTLDYTRTYREFRRDVDQVAAAMIAMGVKPGYHVAVWATNVPQWFLAFWAAVKIGAVLVTVNTAYKINEAEYLLRQSDTHTLIMIEDCKDSNYREIISTLCPELATMKPGEPLHAKRLPFLRHVVTVGFSMPGALTWEEMKELSARVPQEEVRRRAAAVKPDDVANMQYTSGTTGFPKGVMLTHNNIINNGKIIGDRMDLSTADRMMIQVPMFHCFGMVLSMTSTM